MSLKFSNIKIANCTFLYFIFIKLLVIVVHVWQLQQWFIKEVFLKNSSCLAAINIKLQLNGNILLFDYVQMKFKYKNNTPAPERAIIIISRLLSMNHY